MLSTSGFPLCLGRWGQQSGELPGFLAGIVFWWDFIKPSPGVSRGNDGIPFCSLSFHSLTWQNPVKSKWEQWAGATIWGVKKVAARKKCRWQVRPALPLKCIQDAFPPPFKIIWLHYGILVPWWGIKLMSPALEEQSVDQWTTRKVPECTHFFTSPIYTKSEPHTCSNRIPAMASHLSPWILLCLHPTSAKIMFWRCK